MHHILLFTFVLRCLSAFSAPGSFLRPPENTAGAFTEEEQKYCYDYEAEPLAHWDGKEKELLAKAHPLHDKYSSLKPAVLNQEGRLKALQNFRRSVCLELKGVQKRGEIYLREIQEKSFCKMTESMKDEYLAIGTSLGRFSELLKKKHDLFADLDAEGFAANTSRIRGMLAKKQIKDSESELLHKEAFEIWASGIPGTLFKKHLNGILAERLRLEDRLQKISKFIKEMSTNTKRCETAAP